MAVLNEAARELIESGALAHLVTINEDGSPQMSVIWVGLDGDELVSGHVPVGLRKLRDVRRDPRVALFFPSKGRVRTPSVCATTWSSTGRRASPTAAPPELLHRLAQTYIGPGAVFPPMPDPPPGFVAHIAVTRVGGSGPWA